MFAALAIAAEHRMCNFISQGLANAAWAFATANQSDASLFAALATAAERRMSDFNSQDLANAAWAFARASQGDVSIFAALATVPPLVWRGRLPGVPVSPSVLFCTLFSIIF